MADAEPVVGVVVTTTAAPGERLGRCLDALVASRPNGPMIVVDNSGSGVELPNGFEHVAHLRTENDGYGAAANAGIAQLAANGADRIVLVNDDVSVDRDWLGPLQEELDADPHVGAVQPMLVLSGSEPPLVNSLGVDIDRHGAGVDAGYRTPVADADPAPRDIGIFTGGAVMFRRAFLDDTNGFDERLFLYYEDVDLALRGAARGWRYRVVPESRVEHSMGATTEQLGDERLLLQERNRLVNAVRHGRLGLIGRSFWLSVRRLRHPPRRVHGRALFAAIARAPRAVVERLRAARLS